MTICRSFPHQQGPGCHWAERYDRLKARIESCGIRVQSGRLGPQTTGVFDGLSITTNSNCDIQTRCHNLGHAFGHVIQWSREGRRCQTLYDELYAAKEGLPHDRDRLEYALTAFREYEVEASDYAAGLLLETGNADALGAFTLFARADIEAIVSYHRDGVAPIWDAFFARWKDCVACGEFEIAPFAPKAIPPFSPIAIAPQEVIRAVDEGRKAPLPA